MSNETLSADGRSETSYPTMDAWTAALETAAHVHWAVEINSPVYTRWDGRRGYTNRWGRFIQSGTSSRNS